MKKLWIVGLALLLAAVGCAGGDETKSPEPTAIAEDSTAPYLNPLSEEEVAQEEIFNRFRFDMLLPATAVDASFAVITTRRGVSAAQARFYSDEILYYYRIAYTVSESNLADDSGAYLSITEESCNEQTYTLCLSETTGRAQWYDDLSGTSRSLYCPAGVDADALRAMVEELIGA
ncbi:MAG: hypothetical protein Q4C04_02670 [Clostridia bacterium]|nr:hypothetical protein [Clostridia bacterium]